MPLEETTTTIATSEKEQWQPISHECAFLETYFYSIVQFQFDIALEYVEKERTPPLDPKTPLWNGLLNSLITFANAEKGYFAMGFVEKQRIFNLTLKPIYWSLSNEYMVLLTSAVDPGKSEALVREICKQLNQFVQARLKMIDFYEYFMKCKWSNVRNTNEIISTIREVSHLFTKAFHHPVLDQLKTGFNFETEIITCVLTAEYKLCEWDFLESLLTLRECQSKLHAWRLLSPSNSVREQRLASFKYSFFVKSSKKQAEAPALYQWLQRFYCHLLSKFSLYFYTTLNSQAASPDLKGSLSKNSIDYIGKMTNFQRKTDAHSVSLILDASSKEKVYKGHGYFMDNTLIDSPTGINSYPSVVSIPENIPKEHWPNIISMLTDARMMESNGAGSEKVCYVHDDRMDCTYFWVKVDVRLTLVVVYRVKKKEKDSYINNFMLDMRSNLRYEKLFQILKPSQSKLLF